MPVDPDKEPLFPQQWYLENTGQSGGTPGVDINARAAWQLATGAGVTIGVNDTGISRSNPDLQPNLDASRGGNFIRGRPADAIGPEPSFPAPWHGTGVSAMAAADDNGTGLLGAAPDATLASLVGLGRLPAIEAYNSYDVVNASWGVRQLFADDFSTAAFRDAGEALFDAAETGRDGLGTVTVFAAGNDFTRTGIFGFQKTGVGDANYHNFQNARVTIPVAALNDDGTFAAPGNPAGFTTPGAPVLVAAPGTQVLTADLPGQIGNDPGETTVVNGTSFAAPLVSGVVAQMLEINPDLGHRDVQEILAYTARQNDPDQDQWRINGADTWNGGGLHTNPNYGFGLVDAAAAVRLADSWRETDTSDNEVVASETVRRPATIANRLPAVEQSVRLDGGVSVETVALDVALEHRNLGDVTVTLTSPSGTRSTLINRPDGGDFGNVSTNGYRLTSNEFYGESSNGVWTVRIFDSSGALFSDGTLFNWRLSTFGSPNDADDTYVYTDAFAEVSATDASRSRLSDAAGHDILNAAATGSAVTLDLTAGTESRIAGRTLEIAQGTRIEDAFGGGGEDTLSGNAAANRLDGGPGIDTVMFDAALTGVTFQREDSDTVRATGAGSTDTLVQIERASFTEAMDVPIDELAPPLATPALDVTGLSADAQAAALYVGFFDRAPSDDGLDFWTGEIRERAGDDTGDVINDVAEGGFRRSAEAIALFPFLDVDSENPESDAVQAFVTGVFRNLFDRGPDQEGLAFWSDKVETRLESDGPVGDVIIDIMSGARNTPDQPDRSTLTNRIEGALAYGEATDGADLDRTAARELIGDIGPDEASLVTALDARDIPFDSGASDPIIA